MNNIHTEQNVTPRLDPTQITHSTAKIFRLIAQVKKQPTDDTLILSSPTTGKEFITLDNVRVTTSKKFDIDGWYEFICRGNDSGDNDFLILDSIDCKLNGGENISIDGIVALQQLCSKFPEMY